MQVLKKYKITCALIFGFLLYGISSLLYIKLLEVGHSQFEIVLNQFIYFQISTIIFSFVYERFISKVYQEKVPNIIKNQNYIFIYFIFIFSFIIFFFFPWTEDRESKMAQFAGFLRLLWFVLLIDVLNGSTKDYKFLIMNIILMFIDNSRSTFAAIFLVHFFRRDKFNIILISLGTISVFLVASLRSGIFSFSSLFESLFLYGFIGEGINGSLGSLQVLKIDTTFIESILISTTTFFQPFLVLPKYILFFDFAKYLDTSHFYTVLVDQQLGEVYYPMAGFYLVSQFVTLSYLGSFFLLFYIVFSLKLVRIMFKRADFAFLFTLLILMIKMSPFTFWKWVLYLFFISIVINSIRKIKFRTFA